jgi:hypothetical protein
VVVEEVSGKPWVERVGTNTREPGSGYFLSVADPERSIFEDGVEIEEGVGGSGSSGECNEAVGIWRDGIGKAARPLWFKN